MNDIIWDLIEQADEQGGDDPDIRDALLVELVVQECANFLKDKLEDHFAAEQLEEYLDRKSTRLNSSHIPLSRMPSSA